MSIANFQLMPICCASEVLKVFRREFAVDTFVGFSPVVKAPSSLWASEKELALA